MPAKSLALCVAAFSMLSVGGCVHRPPADVPRAVTTIASGAPEMAELVLGSKVADNVFSGLFAFRFGALAEAVKKAASTNVDYLIMFKDYHGPCESIGILRSGTTTNLFWIPMQDPRASIEADMASIAVSIPPQAYRVSCATAAAPDCDRLWREVDKQLDPSLSCAYFSDSIPGISGAVLTVFIVRRSANLSVYVVRDIGTPNLFQQLSTMMMDVVATNQFSGPQRKQRAGRPRRAEGGGS